MPFLYARVAESVDATDFKKNEGDMMNIYKQKDGRRFIVYKGSDNKYHSKSYARYLMEQYLGRELTDREEVHHKDHNKTNDVIENLEVKDKTVHRKEHFKKVSTIEHCYICKKKKSLLIVEEEQTIIAQKIKIQINGSALNIVPEYLVKKSSRIGNFLTECHQIRGNSH